MKDEENSPAGFRLGSFLYGVVFFRLGMVFAAPAMHSHKQTRIIPNRPYGSKTEMIALLDESTAYIERSNLTSRAFNARQTRKMLAFSKKVFFHETAALLEDCYYNLVYPHKSMRLPLTNALLQKWLPRTPAMASGLTDHILSIKELFSVVPIPINTN